jgi:NADH-ubiquinone oxidoreductase chain 5
MYLLPIYFSIMNFLLFFFLGKYFSKSFILMLSSINILISIFVCIFIIYEVCILNIFCEIELFSWIQFDWFKLNWYFYYDNLTAIMLLVINLISFAAHFYSIEYMNEDPYYKRFMTYLSLFTFFMIILVSSDNFIQLFIGWEGVGICSYLLINFWYTRLEANKAALLAVLTNKIGDLFIMLVICIILYNINSVSFSIINYLLPNLEIIFDFNKSYWIFINYLFDNNIIYDFSLNFYINNNFYNIYFYNLIGIFIFIGVMAKSAQFGLHIWLPEAMEGPTPVSSLIHAATMVTAGIFLILRFSFFFIAVPYILLIIFFIGSFTVIISTLIGCFQQDIKKVVAYSTCSQLAYMVAACGLTGYVNGFFHLYTHAFFKALLFLSSGYIIHIMNNQQDTRFLFNSGIYTLIFNIVFFVGSLSIAGFPFLSGFYSKENLIYLSDQINISNYFNNNLLISIKCLIYILNYLDIIALLGTAFYSLKICFDIGLQFKYDIYIKFAFHFSHFFTIFSLFLLFLFTLCIGYLSFDFFLGLGNSTWNTSLYINYNISSSYFISLMNNLEFQNNFENILVWISSISLMQLSFFFFYYFNLILFFIKITYSELYLINSTKLDWLNKFLELMYLKIYKISLNKSYQIIEKGYLEYYFINRNLNIFKHIFNLLMKESKFIIQYIIIVILLIIIILNYIYI